MYQPILNDNDPSDFLHPPTDEDEKGINKKEQIINELIDEIKQNRNELRKHIEDLESIKATIEKLFPSNLDARYMRFFEEKIKTTTSLFSSILQTRQEIHKSLKDEIELRSKYFKTGDGDDNDEIISHNDLRLLAERLEIIRGKKKEVKVD